MSDIAYIKCCSLLASASGLWFASLSPGLSPAVQGLCLLGALASCGYVSVLTKRSIHSEAVARVRQGFNFEAIKKEMAVAAASMEQAVKAKYFPNDVDDPMAQRQELERAYAQSPGPMPVSPELVAAVRALRGSGMNDEQIAIACLGGADAADGVEQILKIGAEQGLKESARFTATS